MAGELLINDDGSIGIGPAGDASVVTDDGRCPVCGCGEYDDGGGPVDPPPPVDPDSYYLGAPCDPNAGNLERPVVFYVPPREDWPPGGYDYDCSSDLAQGAVENRCFFFTSRSPKVSGDVVRDPGSPYTKIGGVEYIVQGASVGKQSCCACRPECGSEQVWWFFDRGTHGANGPVPCWCNENNPCEVPTRECCCNPRGQMTYVTDIFEESIDYELCNGTTIMPIGLRRKTMIRGGCPGPLQPGELEVTVDSEEFTFDELCRPVVRTQREVQVIPINECNCRPITKDPRFPAGPEFKPECIVAGGDGTKATWNVEFACRSIRRSKQWEIPRGNDRPPSTQSIRVVAEVLFDQGTCLDGCADEDVVLARPGGGTSTSQLRPITTIAPGGVPRLF